MRTKILFFFLVCIFFTISFNAKAQAINKQDSLALVGFYDSTGGAKWYNHYNWLTAAPVSSWAGITVSSGRIKKIDLSRNNLSGILPSTLGSLTGLQQIFLPGNSIGGKLPSSLNKLIQLTDIDLSRNHFIGSISTGIGSLVNMVNLDLSFNSISGPIPSGLANLLKLQTLNISYNQLSGTITTITKLTQLKRLLLSGNLLTGTIPAGLANLTSLTEVSLYGNQFSGHIPIAITNLHNIVTMDLGGNRFNFTDLEPIAKAFGNKARYYGQASLPIVQKGNTLLINAGGTISKNTYNWYKNGLVDTTITGDSTRIIGKTATNYYVTITNTIATGLTLASGIYNVPQKVLAQDSLALVDIYKSTAGAGWINKTGWLTGPITKWFGVTLVGGRVTELNLNNNNLSGKMPVSTGNLTGLKRLVYSYNQLIDTIPSTITSLTNLAYLALDNNKLTGVLPAGIGNLKQLVYLSVDYNKLTSIPASIGNLTKLQSLSLRNNNFTGKIPAALGNLTKLTDLDLSFNQFTDSIPSAIGKLSNLGDLNLSYNMLSGEIPTVLNNLHKVSYVQLSNNKLSGNIPLIASNFPAMSYIDISFNYYNFTPLEKIVQIFGYKAMFSPQFAKLHIQANDKKLFASGAGGTPANNSYAWYQNGMPVGRTNDSIFTPYYPGKYTAAAFNSVAGFVTLNSDAITVTSVASAQDSLELVKLYNSTGGANWHNHTGWLAGPVKNWYGITLDLTGRVLRINLQGNGLKGTIPTDINKLTYLQVLYLDNNQLSGTIPGSLFTLPYLKEISLASNLFAGNIPATLGKLVNLTRLDLYGNKFTGNIPAELANLKNLEVLVLSNNRLNGDVPAFLGSYAKLWLLGIEDNYFTFNGMAHIVNKYNAVHYSPQHSLHITHLNKNILVSAGSPVIKNTYKWHTDTGIVKAAVGDSTFTPVILGKYWVTITNTSVAGLTITSDTVNITHNANKQDSLALVDLFNSTKGTGWQNHKNWLAGPVLSWYGLTLDTGGRVINILLPNNKLNGTIPTSIGNVSKLKWLFLGYDSNLTGSIPAEISKLSELERLFLDETSLTGSIPASLGNLHNLQSLSFSNNKLTGQIPAELGNLPGLKGLNLGSNKLVGNIPSSLGNLANLTYLNLVVNQLNGPIPAELGNLINLQSLDLSINQLTGNIPASLGKLKNLQSLFMANNQLSGAIPAALGNLNKLMFITLNDNKLSGKVPSLSNLTHLQSIDLYSNRFTFDGMEAIAKLFDNNPNINNYYFSQATLPMHVKNKVLSVYAGGTLANNTYKWYRNDTLVATKTNDSTFTSTGKGKYAVIVTNAVAKGLVLYSDTINTPSFANITGVPVSSSISAGQGKLSAQITVYPNPVVNIATVLFTSEKQADYHLLLTDASGKVLKEVKGKTVVGVNRLLLDMHLLPAAVYWVFITSDGKTKNITLIKQ